MHLLARVKRPHTGVGLGGPRLIRICLVVALVWLVSVGVARAQGPGEAAIIQQTIDRMTVDEKIGQLFLVTFQGADASATSDIAQLIRDYHIGGVVLSAGAGNVRNEQDTPRKTAELTNSLQRLALDASKNSPVPLFLAVSQEGDGYPNTTLRSGFTPLPSAMALGATWRESNSQAAGRIAGQELASVGVNMLLGPSLDTLTAPGRVQAADLGVRSFGGSPQWVGRLGRAYIQGVHQGSVARVVTIARHFPGIGVSDRSPEDEVATVERAQADLRRLDLAPFLTVAAGPANVAADTTDGLMTALVRFRALQGGASRPIALDAQGLQGLLALPDLATWRERGLLVSDALGAPAVRKSYDPSLQTFNPKTIARDAFLAGNDLLYLGRFALTDNWPDQLANTKATIEFFREQYKTDKTFQERVDRSVRRILLLKRRMYPTFSADSILVDSRAAADRVGRDEAIITGIAREAITLVSPSRDELSGRLPRANESDRIVIVTDSRTGAECATCPPTPLIPKEALQDAIVRLYGPSASGIIAPDRVASLSYGDLKSYLTQSPTQPEETRQKVDVLLRDATWIIFATLDGDTTQYGDADALRLFLRDRRDLFRDKRVVAVAYGAPYYLDATEISKLTAYYAAYGKTAPFIEASVRAIFQEFQPAGASPVSIPGTAYDLTSVLEPDPQRPVPLSLTDNASGDKVQVGQTVTVHAGPILDRNGRPVPDRTPVNLTFFYRAEARYLQPQTLLTRAGIAESPLFLERPGQLEITASAGQASSAAPLTLAVQGEGPVTATPPPTATVTPLPTVTATLTPSPTRTPSTEPPPSAEPSDTRWLGLFASLAAMVVVGSAGAVSRRDSRAAPSRTLRLALVALVWGLVGYLLYAAVAGLNNTAPPSWAGPLVSALFAALPVVWFSLRGR